MSDDSNRMEFNGFLQQLADGHYLEDPMRAITKLVIDKGREVFSGNQEFVFQWYVIDEYVHEV